MKVTVDIKNFELIMQYDDVMEHQQIKVTFTRKIKDWKFKTKHKRWNGSVEFMKGVNRLPLGLWRELKTMCNRFGFPLMISGMENVIDKNLSFDDIDEFCTNLMEHHQDISNRPMQIDSVFKAIKYRYGIIDMSTAGGKTIIEYMYIMWLFYHKKISKVLIVCPDMDLVVQTHQEFIMYNGGKFNMKIGLVHGGSALQDISEYKIIIGNFQSLSNRKPEFFKDVSCLIVDEVHRAGNNSIKYIFEQCSKVKYRLGLSGSIVADKHADYYTILAHVGPVVKIITKKDVIDKGYASDIEVRIFKLNYMSIENRKKLAMLRHSVPDGEKRFRIEQKIVRESTVRLKWISELVSRMKGNVLVFFLDKKYGYGKQIVNSIREVAHDKEVYYVDGDVKKDLREVYKSRMEEGDNKVLVASYDTYSTGKSIKNLHYIVCAESRKGEEVINQSTGRGMRLHESKDKCIWVDIADDFSVEIENYSNKNYMMKHLSERIKYYDKWGFKREISEIDLTNFGIFKSGPPSAPTL